MQGAAKNGGRTSVSKGVVCAGLLAVVTLAAVMGHRYRAMAGSFQASSLHSNELKSDSSDEMKLARLKSDCKEASLLKKDSELALRCDAMAPLLRKDVSMTQLKRDCCETGEDGPCMRKEQSLLKKDGSDLTLQCDAVYKLPYWWNDYYGTGQA